MITMMAAIFRTHGDRIEHPTAGEGVPGTGGVGEDDVGAAIGALGAGSLQQLARPHVA
jgi:hypothetical protein